MWVKICGNTNLDDCMRAADLGADALGFVFAQGKRTVSAAQVAAIAARLPKAIDKVGVFTSGDFAEIVSVVEEAGLTGVQLHSSLNMTLTTRLREHFRDTVRGCSLFQVAHWWVDRSSEEQRDAFAAETREAAKDGSIDALLIDSRSQETSGGTGRTFDWPAVHGALAGVNRSVVVAGGLTPQNVGRAIRALAPWGVDVASGVEAAPGRKDPAKLTAFLEQARRHGESFD